MALPEQKTVLEIPFGGGIDSKISEKLLKPPRLADLQNALFTTSGSYIKRSGYVKLLADTSLTKVAGIFDYKGSLLVAADNHCYTYNNYISGSEDFVDEGILFPISAEETAFDSKSANQTGVDMVIANGMAFTVWVEDDGTVTTKYSIREATSGNYLVAPTTIANASKARILKVSNFVFIFYWNSSANSIRALKIPLAFYTSTTDYEIVTSVHADGIYDICQSGSKDDYFILVYKKDNAGTAEIWSFTESTSTGVGTATTLLTAVATYTEYKCIAVYDTGTRLFVAGGYNGNIVTIEANGRVGAFSLIVPRKLAAGNLVNVAVVATDDSTTFVWYETTHATDSWNHKVELNDITLSGATTQWHCSLASKAFLFDGTEPAVHVCHDTNIQRTYFLVDQTFGVQAKCCVGVAQGNVEDWLPTVQASGSTHYWPAVFRERLQISGTTYTGQIHAQKSIKQVTYNVLSTLKAVEHKDTLYINSGILWQYDGSTLCEQGFHVYPENVTTAGATGSGNLTLTSTYNYRVYYEWVNANGERQISTTAAVTSETTTGTENEIVFSIPTLSFTKKSDVYVGIYRAVADADVTAGDPLRRITNPDPASTGDNAWLDNDTTTTAVAFTDRLSDANLLLNELDYLNVEIDHVPATATEVVATAKNRVWAVNASNRSQAIYSKLNPGVRQLEFNDSSVVTLPEYGGAITAIAGLNNFVVFFKRDSCWAVSGEGRNNTGQGFFNIPQVVSLDIGCINQHTIAYIPQGVIFLSEKGFWRLGHNLDLQYVGANAETYNDQVFTSTVVLNDTNEIRFLTSSGRTLSYNYLIDEWSTFTNHEGTAAALVNDVYYYARNDGKIYKQNDSVYTDDGVFYSLLMKTAPIAIKGVQGSQRVRQLLLLGNYKTDHQLRVRVSYDHWPGWQDTGLWTAADYVSSSFYGDGTYGDGTYGGAGNPVYQAEFRMPRQKCSVVQFIIDDKYTSIAGESMEIVGLQLELAARFGTTESEAGRKFTGN